MNLNKQRSDLGFVTPVLCCILASATACSDGERNKGAAADGGVGDGGLDTQAVDSGAPPLLGGDNTLLPNPADIPREPKFFAIPLGGTSEATLHHLRAKATELVSLPNALLSLSSGTAFSLSADGAVWQDRISKQAFEGKAVVHQDRIFRYGMPFAIESSQDGVEWERETVPASSLRPLASMGSQLVGVDPATGLIWRRGVAGTWYAETRPAPTKALAAFATDGTTTIAVGEDGLALRSSSSGLWSDVSLDVRADFIAAIAWRGHFVGLLSDSRILMLGPDGSWQKVFEDPKVALSTIVGTDRALFAMGHNTDAQQAAVHRTLDGARWQTLSLAGAGPIVDGASLAGTTYALDEAGAVFASGDGIVWSPVKQPSRSYNSVNFLGDRFVAVGEGGLLTTSPDGVTWQAGVHPFKGDLNASAHAAGRLVVGGVDGLLQSMDGGATWTRVESPLTDVQALAFGGAQWLAIDAEQRAFTSPDLVKWTRKGSVRSMPPATPFGMGAAHWNGRFCAKSHDSFVYCLEEAEWTQTQLTGIGMAGQFGYKKMLVNGARMSVMGTTFAAPAAPTPAMPSPGLGYFGWPQDLMAAKPIAFTSQRRKAGTHAVWAANNRQALRFNDDVGTSNDVNARHTLSELPTTLVDIATGAGRLVLVGQGEMIASLPITE